MKVRNAILTVLALVVLTGPLGGCRYFRKGTPAQPQMQAGTAVRTTPPTVMRAPSTTYVANRPSPPTAPPTNWGTPDGPVTMNTPGTYVAPAPNSFPAAAPAPAALPAVDPSAATSAIIAERESRNRLDQQIVALEDRLRQTEQAIALSDAPPSATAPVPAGGEAQAARFASAMQGRCGGQVEQNGSLVVLRFSDAFQSGSEKLKADARLKSGLLAAANELAKSPGVQIQVVGHSDGQKMVKSKPRWGTNVNLSRARAQTVATELSKHGVPAGRIGVDGRGSVEPLVFPENSAKDRAQNRRVEIHVRF